MKLICLRASSAGHNQRVKLNKYPPTGNFTNGVGPGLMGPYRSLPAVVHQESNLQQSERTGILLYKVRQWVAVFSVETKTRTMWSRRNVHKYFHGVESPLFCTIQLQKPVLSFPIHVLSTHFSRSVLRCGWNSAERSLETGLLLTSAETRFMGWFQWCAFTLISNGMFYVWTQIQQQMQ